MKRPLIAGLLAALLIGTIAVALALALRPDAPPDGPGPRKLTIGYDSTTNTIWVKSPGALVTLTDIHKSLGNDSLLERGANSDWLLKANLLIGQKVRLLLHGDKASGDVNWLKLKSDQSGFVSLQASDGQVSIKSTRITSWDEQAGTFDYTFDDGSGRAFVSVKNRRAEVLDVRMDVIDSEIAYLGYPAESSYGISWKVIAEAGASSSGGVLGQGITGNVVGSSFHHNYFGAYVFGAGNMLWKDNEFYENVVYGLDPYNYSQRLLVEGNVFRDNGKHGLIFARGSGYSIIRNNHSYRNAGNGIVLHEGSDNNVVEGNEVYANTDGIVIFQSSNNRVMGNTVRQNVTGIRIYGRQGVGSSGNVVEDNRVLGNDQHGIYLYDFASENYVRKNRIESNGKNGIYLNSAVDNDIQDNLIGNNAVGVRIDSAKTVVPSRGNLIEGNVLQSNQQAFALSETPVEDHLLEHNLLEESKQGGAWNAKTVAKAAFIVAAALVVGIATFPGIARLRVASRLSRTVRLLRSTGGSWLSDVQPKITHVQPKITQFVSASFQSLSNVLTLAPSLVGQSALLGSASLRRLRSTAEDAASKTETRALAAIMLLAIALRFAFLGQDSFWSDEIISVQRAQEGWFGDSLHMALYHAALHLWIRLGDGEAMVRTLSVIFGVAAVPLVYALGARLFGARVGLISALLLTLSAFHIQYSQEARAYSLLVVSVTLSSLLFVRNIERPSKAGWAGYIIIGAAGVYCHVFGILALVSHGSSLLFLKPSRVPWKALLASWAILGLLISPFASNATSVIAGDPEDGSGGIGWINAPDWETVYESLISLTGNGGSVLLLLYLVPLFVALFLATRAFRSSGLSIQTWKYAFILTWLVAPVGALLAVSLITPVFVSRYLLISLPPLLIVAALTIDRLWGARTTARLAAAAIAALLVALSAVGDKDYYTEFEKEDWRGAVNVVASQWQSGDGMLFYMPWMESKFQFYLERSEQEGSELSSLVRKKDWEQFIVYGERPSQEQIARFLPDHAGRVWLIEAHTSHPERRQVRDDIRAALGGNYPLAETSKLPKIIVTLFSRAAFEATLPSASTNRVVTPPQ